MRCHLLFILPLLLLVCQSCHGHETNRSPEFIHSLSGKNKVGHSVRIKFEQNMYVFGVKQDVELNTELIVFKAQVDPDWNQVEGNDDHIEYSLLNVTYVREKKATTTDFLTSGVFKLDPRSGSLKNAISLRPYVQGYFDMIIQAKMNNTNVLHANANDISLSRAKLFILHSKDLLKFVFHKKPNQVKEMMSHFKHEFEGFFDGRKQSQQSSSLQSITPLTSLFLYDTQYHERNDGTLDFESSSSCFQIILLNSNTDIEDDNNHQSKSKNNSNHHHILHDKVFTSDEAMKMLKSNSSMKRLFSKYAITSIDHCVPLKPTYRVSRSEMGIIIIAAFIAIVSLLFACIGTRMKHNFKHKLMSVAASSSQHHGIVSSPSSPQVPYGVPHNASSFVTSIPEHHQRIYDWQDTNPPLDVVSFRSFPTLR